MSLKQLYLIAGMLFLSASFLLNNNLSDHDHIIKQTIEQVQLNELKQLLKTHTITLSKERKEEQLNLAHKKKSIYSICFLNHLMAKRNNSFS